MGNENDKRLNKSKNNKNNNNKSNNNNNNNNNNDNNTVTNNQASSSKNINLNQNERINPYDVSANKKPINNNPQANPHRPQLEGIGDGGGRDSNQFSNNIKRSMTFGNKVRPNTITTKMLKDAFRNYSIDGSYLNRQRFNDAIESIFRFDIPEMHYTHLSNKIYDLLDSSGDGKIQEDEFLEGFGSVLKDKNFRLLLSMMAMMSLPDKTRDYIEIREIKEYFYNSYIEGFKHLGWQIKRKPEEFRKYNLPVPTIEQLEAWAQKCGQDIIRVIEYDLKQFSQNLGNSMTFEQFMRWMGADHTLYIQFGNKKIRIATSLTGLDGIYYDETS
jgi:hypothetical protein